MGYTKQVYDRAWDTLARRRADAEADLQARRARAIERAPEIGRIEREMARAASNVTKAIISSPAKAEELVLGLGEENLRLQKQREELLIQNGYSADYLAEQFFCHICRDKGYDGSQMCTCMQTLLKQEAYAQLGRTSRAKDCTFANFSLSYYPDTPVDSSGIVPRVRMGEILALCMQYADSFSLSSESLLLLGQTGLGKTHLSLAISAAATEAGFGVVYAPVQRLFDALEAEKFSRDADTKEQYVQSTRFVQECDLLVLDDLGTEFTTQFTNSVLYSFINSRLVEGRPTIISTNLDLPAIEEKYSQRMVSRLICTYRVLKLYGKDIRYIKKTQG